MTKTITHNDLIKYIYNETTVEESIEIQKAITLDNELADSLYELSSTAYTLNKNLKSPSKGVVDNILDYAKAKNVKYEKI